MSEILTPTVLTIDLVEEMVRIAGERIPNEACGVIIPTHYRGQRVFEMPNRAKKPRESFEMNSEDISIALEGWIEKNRELAVWGKLVIWHSHPNGLVGPSKTDLDNRIQHCGNLVVSLTDEGPKVTWF